jgi:glycosyltransferase involved in cell wall biosynthesis
VDFPGFAENVSDCLLNSYLFILPSRLEGLSNALLEAMSLGVPCVVTDISGNQDLIKHRISGLLVPSENPEALAEAVSFMLDNPEKAIEMGYNARKTIEKEYAISSIADKYISLYRELNRKGKEPCAV